MDEPTLVGWARYTWRTRARRCLLCQRKVRRGVVNVRAQGHEMHPNFRVICLSCYERLDDANPERTPL